MIEFLQALGVLLALFASVFVAAALLAAMGRLNDDERKP
jgi:hypothetical protein